MLRSRHLLRGWSASAMRFIPARAVSSMRNTLPSTGGSAVRVISDLKDYEDACKASEGKLIVAYHTAAWCGPCKRIWPHVQELANDNADVAVLKIDVDECQDVAAANGIQAMPTFLMIKDGKVVDQIVGAALDKLLLSVTNNK